MRKKKNVKQKQRQSQHQKVVINMGNTTRRRRRRRRKAPLRSATNNVIKHVHSYQNNVFQANLERERADINREMSILRSERAELAKLKALEDKRSKGVLFSKNSELESGTTPTKSQFEEVVKNIAPKTPVGTPPKNGRKIIMDGTQIPRYQTPTESFRGKTLNLNDL